MDYLLTPWSRILLDKLTGLQLVKKFPAFYGIRRFITAFSSAWHMSYPELPQSSQYPHIPLPGDPSSYYPPIYAWVSTAVSFPQAPPPKPCIYLSPIRTQEKLTGPHLVKKFPAFYGIPRFITAFTSALHLSLSWARSIQLSHWRVNYYGSEICGTFVEKLEILSSQKTSHFF
jgi:hypothetical protein